MHRLSLAVAVLVVASLSGRAADPATAPKSECKAECAARAKAAFAFASLKAEAAKKAAPAVAPMPAPKAPKVGAICVCGDSCKCPAGTCPSCPAATGITAGVIAAKPAPAPVVAPVQQWREVWYTDGRRTWKQLELVGDCPNGKCPLPR